jgi:uncharacterized protein YbaA (DUF1428 family)
LAPRSNRTLAHRKKRPGVLTLAESDYMSRVAARVLARPRQDTHTMYVDCFMTPVPRANKAKYERLAKISSAVVREFGAHRVVESWLDEGGADASSYHAETARQSADTYSSFLVAARAKGDETVVVSWIEWADKQTRDAGMAKVMADPRMQFGDEPSVFDGARLLAAGFVPMLDDAARK